jgi:hypothetical protein
MNGSQAIENKEVPFDFDFGIKTPQRSLLQGVA